MSTKLEAQEAILKFRIDKMQEALNQIISSPVAMYSMLPTKFFRDDYFELKKWIDFKAAKGFPVGTMGSFNEGRKLMKEFYELRLAELKKELDALGSYYEI